MEAVAASADGRALVFEAQVGTPLSPGDFAVVAALRSSSRR